VGAGSTFCVGSLWDGDIYRGDLRTGDGDVFIDVTGRQSLGMKVDEGRHRLFAAGRFTGHAYVYDVSSSRSPAVRWYRVQRGSGPAALTGLHW